MTEMLLFSVLMFGVYVMIASTEVSPVRIETKEGRRDYPYE